MMKKNVLPPPIRQLRTRAFPEYQQIQCANGAKIVLIHEPDWKVFRLEACFLAGRPFEHKKGAAKATAELLREGSPRYNGLALAEKFEAHGASISSKSGIDTAHVMMHAPTDQFFELWPVMQDILIQPSFPPKEWKKYQRRQKEKILSDLTINEVVSYRQLTENLFGTDHPYGYNSTPQTYLDLSPEDLHQHHLNCYGPSRAMFILAGGWTEAMVQQLQEDIEQWPERSFPDITPHIAQTVDEKHRTIRLNQPYQASIRLGKLLFPYEHPDYAYMQITNTLLGGYFGSRLMKKIREEEGLSYHVFSSVESMRYDGYWMIGTETSLSNVDKAIRLIEQEMRKMVEQPIGEDEAHMIRNYMIGNSLQFFEGAFNQSDFLRHHLFELEGTDVYAPLMAAIEEMDPKKIQSMAAKYFEPETLLKVVVE